MCQYHRVSEAEMQLSAILIVFPEFSPHSLCFGVLRSYGVPLQFGFIWNSTPSKADKVKSRYLWTVFLISVFNCNNAGNTHIKDIYYDRIQYTTSQGPCYDPKQFYFFHPFSFIQEEGTVNFNFAIININSRCTILFTCISHPQELFHLIWI